MKKYYVMRYPENGDECIEEKYSDKEIAIKKAKQINKKRAIPTSVLNYETNDYVAEFD